MQALYAAKDRADDAMLSLKHNDKDVLALKGIGRCCGVVWYGVVCGVMWCAMLCGVGGCGSADRDMATWCGVGC